MAVLGASTVAVAVVMGIVVGLAMDTPTIAPLLASVLGTPGSSYAGTITLDLYGLPRDIPDLGRVLCRLPVTSAPPGRS